MRYLILLSMLGACTEDGPSTLQPGGPYTRGPDVDMDAPWMGGATPRERIALLNDVPGTWSTFAAGDGGPDPADQPGWSLESELVLGVAADTAFEYCIYDEVPCSAPLLAVPASMTLAGLQGAWSGEAELCLDPREMLWGMCNPDGSEYQQWDLDTDVAPDMPTDGLCAGESALRVQGNLRTLNADYVIRCDAGGYDVVFSAVWEGENLEGGELP